MAMNPMAGMGRPPAMGGMPPSMGVAPMGQAPSPQMGGGVAPSTGNVMQITTTLRGMPDAQLQQYAAMHKNDPFVFPLAFQESQTRKQMRAGQAAQMAGQKPPPVVDQDLAQMMPQALPEDQGIGALNAPNLQHLADGGIAGYADGGPQQPGMSNYAQMAPAVDLHPDSGVTPKSMAAGGIAHFADEGAVKDKLDYRQMIIDSAIANKVNPKVALRIAGVEGTSKNSKSSATNFFQFIDKTYKDLGGDPALRHDPIEAIRLGGLFLGKNQRALEKSLGRPPEPHELYATHFLGEPIGKALLTANPKQTVSEFLKNTSPKRADDIISANPEVLGRKGEKTVGDVRNWTKLKMAGLGLPAATASTGLPKETAEYLPGIGKSAVDQIPGVNPVIARQQEAKKNAAPEYYTGNQQIVGGAETALQYLTGLPAMLAGPAAHRFTYSPRSTAGPQMSRDFGQFLEDYKVPPYLAHMSGVAKTKRPSGGVANTAEAIRLSSERAANEANIAKANMKPPLIALENNPTKYGPAGEVLPPTTADMRTQNANMLANLEDIQKFKEAKAKPDVTQATSPEVEGYVTAHEKALQLKKVDTANKITEGERVRAQMVAQVMNNVPEASRKQIAGSGTALTPAAGYPNYSATTEAEDASFGKRAPLDITEDKPLEIAKPATEEKKGRNWDDIMLNTGLGLLAGKSPHALQNLGEAGLNALQIERAQTKEAREQKLAELHGQYYAGVGKQAEAQANYLENEKSNTALMQKAAGVTEQYLKAWIDSQANTGVAVSSEDAMNMRTKIYKQTLGMMGLQIPSTMASSGMNSSMFKLIGSRLD